MNQENEANNLILELSADLEEEEQPSQKKKPTIVQAKRTRFVSRPMSKYEKLRKKNCRKETNYLGKFDLF